jgi:hypothetical protein
MTVKEGRDLLRAYKKLKNDKERLEFFMKHNDALMIDLDNDNTTGSFIEEKIQEKVDYLFCFDDDFGDRAGVKLLFKKLGIKAKYV